jgi:hypothetical protein
MSRCRLAVGLLAAVVCLPAPVQGQRPVDFYCDFRKEALPAEIDWCNDPNGEFLHADREGLRIRVPRDVKHGSGGVGVRINVELHGDFDIITTVEVLKLEPPPSGSGAGITLYLPNVAGTEAYLLGRMMGPKGSQFLLSSQQFTEPQNSRWKLHHTPCQETLLRLRLQRTHTTLSYQFAPGRDGPFQEIHRKEVDPGPIKRIRFTAANQQLPAAMEVRFIDFHARTAPAAAAGERAAAEPAAPRPWTSLLFVFLVGLVALLLGVYWLNRRRPLPPLPADGDGHA